MNIDTLPISDSIICLNQMIDRLIYFNLNLKTFFVRC